MTVWIKFLKDNNRAELALNSRMTNMHRVSNLDQIVDEMVGHIETQIKNPASLNSRFRLDEVLFLVANFHLFNLTRLYHMLPEKPMDPLTNRQ